MKRLVFSLLIGVCLLAAGLTRTSVTDHSKEESSPSLTSVDAVTSIEIFNESFILDLIDNHFIACATEPTEVSQKVLYQYQPNVRTKGGRGSPVTTAKSGNKGYHDPESGYGMFLEFNS